MYYFYWKVKITKHYVSSLSLVYTCLCKTELNAKLNKLHQDYSSILMITLLLAQPGEMFVFCLSFRIWFRLFSKIFSR